MSLSWATKKFCEAIVTGFCVVSIAVFLPRPSEAQSKIVGNYTLPEIGIKEFQNRLFPGSVTNDHKILLGSMSSDLWRTLNAVKIDRAPGVPRRPGECE